MRKHVSQFLVTNVDLVNGIASVFKWNVIAIDIGREEDLFIISVSKS